MQAVARIDSEQLQQQKREAAETQEEKWIEVLFKFADARLAADMRVCGHKNENSGSGSFVLKAGVKGQYIQTSVEIVE